MNVTTNPRVVAKAVAPGAERRWRYDEFLDVFTDGLFILPADAVERAWRQRTDRERELGFFHARHARRLCTREPAWDAIRVQWPEETTVWEKWW